MICAVDVREDMDKVLLKVVIVTVRTWCSESALNSTPAARHPRFGNAQNQFKLVSRSFMSRESEAPIK